MIDGAIDCVADGAVRGWARRLDGTSPVLLDLYLDDVHQGAIEVAGQDGGYAFKFLLPVGLPDGTHNYAARVHGTGEDLDGSPLSFELPTPVEQAEAVLRRISAYLYADLKRIGHNGTAVDLQALPSPSGKPRVISYVCVFGDVYTSLFMDVYLLSQLARNNLPWLGANTDHVYAICTTLKDAEYIIAHPNFPAFERHCRIVFAFVEGVQENRISLIESANAFYAVANEAATILPENTFLVLAPDCLWADGAFRQAVKAVAPERGKRILLVPHFMRVEAERIRPLFLREERSRRPIRITPRSLVRMAREHRHAETRIYFKDGGDLGGTYQSHCLLDVGEEGITGRGSALHPLAMRLNGPIATPLGTTVESVADSHQFAWSEIHVLTRRLLHVDCALAGAPRNAVARPFDFDDLGWYHAHGTISKTRDLWKFPIELSEVPTPLRSETKWERANERILAIVERAVLYSRIELLDKTLTEALRRLQNNVDVTLTIVSSPKNA